MIINKREFEKAESGQYIGVVADVADLGLKQTDWGPKAKMLITWLLWGQNAQGQFVPYLNSKGQQFDVSRYMANDFNPKSKAKVHYYETAQSILNGEIPTIDSAPLIGRGNLLFVQKESGTDGEIYANVKAIIPLPAGTVTPAVPATFVRFKDRQPRQGNQFVPAVPSVPQTVGVATPVQQAQYVPGLTPAQVVSQPVQQYQPGPAGVQGSPVIDLNAGQPVQVATARPQF